MPRPPPPTPAAASAGRQWGTQQPGKICPPGTALQGAGGRGAARHAMGGARQRTKRAAHRRAAHASGCRRRLAARHVSMSTRGAHNQQAAHTKCFQHTCAGLALHPSVINALCADGGARPQQALHQPLGQRACSVKLLTPRAGWRAGGEGGVGRRICCAAAGCSTQLQAAGEPRRATAGPYVQPAPLSAPPHPLPAPRTFCRLQG